MTIKSEASNLAAACAIAMFLGMIYVWIELARHGF